MALKAVSAISNDNKLLASDFLVTGMQGIGAASIVLQAYSSTVLAQPDIDLDILPGLPARQAQARSSASQWLKQTNQQAIGSLADVRDFANSMSAYASAMLPLAQTIDSGDRTELPTLIKGLQKLIDLAQEKRSNAENLSDRIQVFRNEIEAQGSAFEEAKALVQQKITGDQGQIAALRRSLADLNSRMNTDMTKIAAGAVSDVVGVGLIVVGATTVIETGGATATIIGAGIGLVSGGTLAIALASSDIADAQKAYGDAISRVVDLELEVAAFDTVAHQITANGEQAKAAAESAGMMTQGWGGIADRYGDLIRDLEGNQSGFLSLRLMSAKKRWENLGRQAGTIMEQGSLSFEERPATRLKRA